MAVEQRTKNQLFLLKVEAIAGVDPTPTSAANAIRVRDKVTSTPNLDKLDTNYVQESISQAPPVIGGGNAGFKGSCWLTGAGTAGTAPDWATFLKSGAMQETLTAADVTGTSQAIAAGTITLAAGASATDDAYKGMIISGTSGSCNGQDRVISAYNGTTKIATIVPNWTSAQSGTPTYAIRANARYVPVTIGQLTYAAYRYKHSSVSGNNSVLAKVLGAMSTFQIGIQSGKLASFDWTLMGIFAGPATDVSRPAAATYAGAAPEAFKNAAAYLGGTSVKLNSFSLDYGATVAQFDDPSQTYGKDTAEVLNRLMNGRLALASVLVATRDAVTDWAAGTTKSLWLNWGSAIGKRISIYIPALQYTGNEDLDINGYAGEGLPFQATGLDSEVYICVW